MYVPGPEKLVAGRPMLCPRMDAKPPPSEWPVKLALTLAEDSEPPPLPCPDPPAPACARAWSCRMPSTARLMNEMYSWLCDDGSRLRPPSVPFKRRGFRAFANFAVPVAIALLTPMGQVSKGPTYDATFRNSASDQMRKSCRQANRAITAIAAEQMIV